jgi:predicted O-linked N-acetylglucosamine transferase (SPINDLY family)
MTLQELMNHAVSAHRAGRLADAEAAYRRIAQSSPQDATVLHLLSIVASQTRRFTDALQWIDRAISFFPNSPEYHFARGVALDGLNRLDEAAAEFQHAIARRPDYFQAHTNLGNVYAAAGQWPRAIEAFQRAAALQPEYGEAHCNLGQAYATAGQLPAAISEFARAVEIDGADLRAVRGLGDALFQSSRHQEAAAAYERAAALSPSDPHLWHNLGSSLHELGDYDRAATAYRHALTLRPDFPEAHFHLAITLDATGDFDESAARYRRDIALRPDHADAHRNLGVALLAQGKVADALGSYDRAIKLKPDDAAIAKSRLFALQFHPAFDARLILQEHRAWNERFAEPLRISWLPHANSRDPNRRLRVGYVSANFFAHCQSLFTSPLLANHDRALVEVYCYADVARPDGVTARLRRCADVWRPTNGLSDAQIADQIRQDRIDILIDLTMHMTGSRPLLFARKPAPIQVAWLAYPGTTGLSAMDYRLTDPYLDPPGKYHDCYSETCVRLPETFWCYDPRGLIEAAQVSSPDTAPSAHPLPKPAPLPALSTGLFTFGCLNNFCKINDSLLDLWSRVLIAVPRSRLLLLAPPGEARRWAAERFRQRGIASDRLEFAPRRPFWQYLNEFNRIDLCLDTLPYNGHTTSLDALWMGVPVVTRVGSTVVGRAGLSQLSNLGLTELVAYSDDEFVQIAASLAGDLSRLAALRSTLRDRMSASPLMDAPRFARNMEAAYRQMWRTWCEKP